MSSLHAIGNALYKSLSRDGRVDRSRSPLESLELISTSHMPRAIISPSVLASDFGQLTAECKRMMKGGAEWLHMGMPEHVQSIQRLLTLVFQMSWMGESLPWLGFWKDIVITHGAHYRHFVPNITMGGCCAELR